MCETSLTITNSSHYCQTKTTQLNNTKLFKTRYIPCIYIVIIWLYIVSASITTCMTNLINLLVSIHMTIQNQGCRNSEPIARHFALFSTLVLLPIYFVYSFTSLGIHYIYHTMSCITGCSHTPNHFFIIEKWINYNNYTWSWLLN